MHSKLSRRSTLSSLAAGSLLVTTGSTPSAAFGFGEPTGTYPQTGFDAENTASTPYTGPRGSLFTCWDRTLPAVYSPPLVTNGGVIALTPGDGETMIRALDRRTGEDRWSHGVDDYVVQSVLGATDEVAITAAILEPKVRAVSLEDGSTVWETAVDELSDGFRMGPRISNGSVYLLAREDRSIHAFDVASGEHETAFDGEYTRFAVDGDTLVASTVPSSAVSPGLALVDASAPSERTVYATNARAGRPTVGEDTIYVGTSTGQVYAIANDTGTTRWSRSVENWAVSLTLTDETLIARTRDGLIGLDPADGSLKWQILGQTTRTVATGDRFYVGTENRIGVGDLAEANEQIAYTVNAIPESINYMTVVDKGIYVASNSGEVAMIGEFAGGTF